MRLVPPLAAALALSGCGTKSEKVAPSPEIRGTLTIDGTPATVTACRPGKTMHTFVEAVAREGVLRFENKQLSWNGEPLTCDQLDRSWGGGSRADGTSYWRGTLVFRCTAGPRTVTGDLQLDCGDITPLEREQLDGQRDELRDEQKKAREGSGATP